MTLRLSTGFQNQLLGPKAFADIFNNGCIRVFSGGQPASADSAEQGTLVGTISNGGGPWVAGSPTNGLQFQLAGASVGQSVNQAWRLNTLLNGTAGWFRLVANPVDNGTANTLLPRIDGAIGAIGAAVELGLAKPLLVSGTQYPINTFLFALLHV